MSSFKDKMNTTVSSTGAFVKKLIRNVILFFILIGAIAFFVKYYSYIFATTVNGVIIGNERVIQPTAILAGQSTIPSAQLFSFAVAVKDAKGEIFTSSSEDRQWAVAAVGMCAEAKFFPYAPWQLDKSGTYFKARLERLYDCPPDLKEMADKATELHKPTATPAPTEQ